MSNEITAYFKGRTGVAESVYQNDYGIVMVFDGIELPAHFDCYFSILNQDEAVPGVGADNRVAIPNNVLAAPGNVTIHIPLHEGENDSEVEYVVEFRVIGRARPIDDGEPAQMTAVEKAIALLQEPIGNIEEIVNEALAFTGITLEELQASDAEIRSEMQASDAEIRSEMQASDAVLNARMDSFTNLDEGSTTGDAELVDGRVGADGVTYTNIGNAIRTQIANVKDDVGSALTFTQKMAVGDGYKRVYFGSIINDKVLKPDGSVVNGTGTGNNWVFEDFVAIPKGTIHFACADDYSYNFVFYDENKNVVDYWGENASIHPYGQTYSNTLASYMRVGCWRSGGVQGTETCFAYVYDEVNAQNAADTIVPLYKNVNMIPPALTTETPSKTRMLSDFIYADVPLMIWSQDTSLVTFGVHLYDANKDYIKTYYATAVTGYVSVPSGYYVRVYLANVSGNIYASKEIVKCVKIERKYDNIGFLSFGIDVDGLASTNQRVGLIDAVYADKDIVIECEDFENYLYNLALYNSNDELRPEYMEYALWPKNKSYIPKGYWYRYVTGKRAGSVASFEDFSKIKVTEVCENTPEMEAVVSALGKMKYQMDSDVLPSYYEQYMAGKVETINNLAESSALQFAFITDYHYGTYNQTHNARVLLTKLVTETPLDIVLNGGDTWTSGHSILEYKEAKRRLMNGIIETTPNAPCSWFFVLGNHDTGLDYKNVDGQTQTFGPYFTTEEFQAIMGGNVTGYDVVYDPNSSNLAYYFDKGNVRVIVTNNSLETVGSSEPMFHVLAFMAKALLTMGDKTAVIISHEYFNPATGEPYATAEQIAEMIVAYNSRSTMAVTNQTSDFRNCTGEIACWIVGHAHMDRDFTLTDGTKVICTTTCNSGAELGGLDRTVGTINENAFDVISLDTTNGMLYLTRIGAGSDREFSI